MDGGMHKAVYNKVSMKYGVEKCFSSAWREILHSASVQFLFLSRREHDAITCATFYVFLSMLQTIQKYRSSLVWLADGVIPPMNSM